MDFKIEDVLTAVNPVAGNLVTAAAAVKTETFGESGSSSLSNLLGTIILVAALYYAFKCKTPTGGIDIVQMLLACCCSPCYLAYRIAVPCGK
jgi:hypothetical protein